jgi:hypothetical protein
MNAQLDGTVMMTMLAASFPAMCQPAMARK